MGDWFPVSNVDYLDDWFENFRIDKNDYIIMTATELYESVKPYYKRPFPLSQKKLGNDINHTWYIRRKKTRKCNMYSINCGHNKI
jgi:hypothetical protein